MQHMLSNALQRCRICDSDAIEPVLDLGRQPFANSLRRDKTETTPVLPLAICRCAACGTIQLTETAPPEQLFSEYVWVTGTSLGARDYSRAFCENLIERAGSGRLFVLEVASNDGTFLQRFRERGHKVLGVDPAGNIASLAEQAKIPTIVEFFGLSIAQSIVADHGPADVVLARNVIPHVADPNDVIAGMAHCLSAGGIGAIEFHRADVILEELHYDSIYHEHLFYHSLHSLNLLLGRHGLLPFDVTASPISGGSLVVFFSKGRRRDSDALGLMLRREEHLGVGEAAPWREFAKRCGRHRETLRALIEAKVGSGKGLIGFGASARSSTLLNYCGIDDRHLLAIADNNPFKQGRFTPGSDVRIVPPGDAFALRPDAMLLLAWNFRDEILNQIATEFGWHGGVIVPLPGDPVELVI